MANSNRTECVCVANENCSATNCGMTPDGCGGAIWCDGCSNLVGGVFGYWCNQSLHECMSEPDTCAVLGATGGIASEGFGGLLSCGGCPELNAWGSNFSCTGANQCACRPETAEVLCQAANTTCGSLPDGCGGQVQCRGCASGIISRLVDGIIVPFNLTDLNATMPHPGIVWLHGTRVNGTIVNGSWLNESYVGGEWLCPDATQTDPCIKYIGAQYHL